MSKMKDYSIDLMNQIKDLKDDRETVYEIAAEIYDYIEENDCIEKEYLYEMLAKIQRFSD